MQQFNLATGGEILDKQLLQIFQLCSEDNMVDNAISVTYAYLYHDSTQKFHHPQTQQYQLTCACGQLTVTVCNRISAENTTFFVCQEVTNKSTTHIPPSDHTSWHKNKATLIVSNPSCFLLHNGGFCGTFRKRVSFIFLSGKVAITRSKFSNILYCPYPKIDSVLCLLENENKKCVLDIRERVINQ